MAVKTLAIRIIYLICSPMSMFGSFVIVIAFGCLPRLRINGVHFVFFQVSPNNLFVSPSNDHAIASPNALCDFTGFMGQFAGQATASWSMMITLRIFFVFLLPSKAKYIRNWWFHAYVWGWSLFTAILMMGLDQYGPTVDGCWIKGPKNVYRIVFFALPIFAYFVLSIVVLLFVWGRLHSLRKQAGGSALEAFEWRFKVQMILYMVIFVVFWTGPIVLRILEWTGVNFAFALYLDALSLVLQGAANALVWTVSRSFCESIQDVCPCYDDEPESSVEEVRTSLMEDAEGRKPGAYGTTRTIQQQGGISMVPSST